MKFVTQIYSISHETLPMLLHYLTRGEVTFDHLYGRIINT